MEDNPFLNDPLLKNLMDIPLQYISPIAIESDNYPEKGYVFASGTCFFIKIDQVSFVVTASHNIEAFRKIHKEDNTAIMRIDKLIFNPEGLIIDESKNLDMITLRIDDKDLELINKQSYQPIRWPISRLREDEIILITGFPGIYRRFNKRDKITFGYAPILEHVKTVSELHFSSQFDRENWHKVVGRFEIESYDNLGGMSGGAVFRCSS
jgi:hypothetical protein